MKKTLLFILTVLVVAPMLSGCFYYPYWDDGYGRYHREDRRYYGRGWGDGYHYGYRDYQERR